MEEYDKVVHQQGLEPWAYWLRVSCSTSWAIGAYPLRYILVYTQSTLFVNIKYLKPCPTELQIFLCDGVYLSSRAVSSQVLSTLCELNFCVRDGNRWILTAINTVFFGLSQPSIKIPPKVPSKLNNLTPKAELIFPPEHSRFSRGQALDRLVLTGLIHHCTYTLSLSTS